MDGYRIKNVDGQELIEKGGSEWEDAFKFFAIIENEEVEDFFVQFLINDENERPFLTKFTNDYFRET